MAQLRYNVLGKNEIIKLFRKEFEVDKNWSYNNNITGDWILDTKVPLPSPVTFINLDLVMKVLYNISIKLEASGKS